jgi:Flp pilus assembly protein TadG
MGKLPGMEWLIFALSVVAAGISFWQASEARAARRDALKASAAADSAREKSQEARDEAREIAKASLAAAERMAEAQERAVALEEEKNKPAVQWQIQPSHGDMQLVVNVGDLAAYDVFLTGTDGVHIDADSNSDRLVSGDSVEFAVWRGMGMGTPRLTIHWSDEPGGEEHTAETAVRPK